MGRRFATVVCVALIGATASPLVRAPADDGFPLSTYPMFAWKRPTQMTMSYPVGITGTAGRRYLSPSVIGSAEILQARAIVDRAVRAGPRETRALCDRIAAAVGRAGAFDDIVEVRVVTGTHDAIAVLVDDRLGVEREHVRCRVPR